VLLGIFYRKLSRLTEYSEVWWYGAQWSPG